MNLAIISIFFTFVITASIFCNLLLLHKLKHKPKRPESVELQEFLADLLSGGSMLAVRRVDPNDFLLRSPKK